MTRVEKILDRVRHEVSDLDKSRWSDINLLGLLSDAQEDIVYKTNCLHNSITIPTSPNKNTYVLPDDVSLLTSISYDNEKLKLVTRDYIEKINKDWTTAEGAPEYAVFDSLDRGSIKITPVPSDNSPLDILYLSNPLPVLSTTDSLSLPSSYDLGLFYYVVARALSIDFDAQNTNVSNRYLTMYDREVKRFLSESSKSFLSTSEPFTSRYNGFV